MARTTIEDIRRWLMNAPERATHMIVACDTFDYEDYPVYIMPHQNVRNIYNKYNTPAKMSRVMEVYNLSMDLEKQLTEGRAFNF